MSKERRDCDDITKCPLKEDLDHIGTEFTKDNLKRYKDLGKQAARCMRDNRCSKSQEIINLMRDRLKRSGLWCIKT